MSINQVSPWRIYVGLFVLIAGFLSPLSAVYIAEMNINATIKSVIIGGLVFGIPELLMILAIVIMGREAYDWLKGKLLSKLKIIVPDRVSKTRYYLGVALFSLCLIEGVIEIHSHYIQDNIGARLNTYHWIMNGLFLLSIMIAGGEFWDKLRALYVYEKGQGS